MHRNFINIYFDCYFDNYFDCYFDNYFDCYFDTKSCSIENAPSVPV